ncbi:MAG: hypothetical protein M3188_08760 [Actinomycetota bacterium]|nr:hypothetical protein [Actinomycetota bacterium]
MSAYPLVEHRTSRVSRWLHERRARAALFIGLLESLFVVFGDLGWFWVVGAAAVAVVLYFAVGRRVRSATVREIAWTLAASQLIALVVPVLWELVKVVAIVVLVLMGLILLALLIRDR